MGIFDEAIREHIDLKRKHGAADNEVDQLEKEAFGPPSRPGEPEFSDTSSWASGPPEDSSSDSDDYSEDETRLHDTSDDGDSESSGEDRDESSESSEPDFDDEAEPAAASTEQGRVDHPDLEETMLHDAVGDEDGDDPDEPDLDSFGEGATAEQVVEIDEPDSEVDEDEPFVEDSEVEDGGDDEDDSDPAAPAAAVEPEPLAETPEIDIDDMDLSLEGDQPTGEQGLDPLDAPGGPADDPGPVASAIPDPPADLTPASSTTGASQAIGDLFDGDDEPFTDEHKATNPSESDGPEGADLLEETPDFLRDAPDGDALWFEQNPPQDFDFEDD